MSLGRPLFQNIVCTVCALIAACLVAPGGEAQTLLAGFPVTNGTVRTTALSADGQTLYLGGDFTYVGPYTGAGARLDLSDGSVIPDDLAVEGSGVWASVPDGAGGYYIGGAFTSVGGQPRQNLARILADGTLDPAFAPDPNGAVQALALSGGTLYVGGGFVAIGGQVRQRLAAVDAATGAADPAFSADANSSVLTLAAGGGALYAGGVFVTVGGRPRPRLAAFDLGPPRAVGSSAAEGWRMISAPVAGLSVQDLAGLNLVSGISGDPLCAAAVDNMFTGYVGDAAAPGTTAGYTAPAAYADVLAPGRSAFWYFYDNPADGGPCGAGATASSVQPLPVTLTAAGVSPTDDVETVFMASDRASGEDTFYLAGNPFGEGFDLDGGAGGLASLSATDGGGAVALQNTVQVWDPAAGGGVGGYVTKTAQADGGTDGAGGTSQTDDLAVWQGVWVERSALAAPSYPLTLRYEADNRTGDQDAGIFIGRTGSESASVRTLRFEVHGLVEGEGVFDGAASLLFAEGATEAWDAYDASKLGAFSAPYALIAPVGQDRDGTLAPKAAESRAFEPGPVAVPLAFFASGAGDFELSWPETATLPETWSLSLLDTETSATVDLRTATSYAFASAATADWAERFVITVTPPTVAGEEGAAEAAVGAVHPNPARGTARVVLTLPAGQHVRAVVVDALGREVALLADGERAGTSELRIDTSRLAAGVYVVRVEGAGIAETRRLTVVR